MKKVSKFVAIICTLIYVPIWAQNITNITIDQQVSVTEFSSLGSPSLLIESIVVEITLADITQLNQVTAATPFAEYTNNYRTNSPISLQERNNALPLFKGELFPLKRHNDMEKQLLGTTPTIMLVENTPEQVQAVPANLKLSATHQNRPKALGSLLKF